MDRWGRKAGVIYCAVFSLIGGALLCGAQNVGMFIAARFIAGWGSWGFLAVSTYNSAGTLVTSELILTSTSTNILRRTRTTWSPWLFRRYEWRQYRTRLRNRQLHGHGLLLRFLRHS
jgi:MFS family permease